MNYERKYVIVTKYQGKELFLQFGRNSFSKGPSFYNSINDNILYQSYSEAKNVLEFLKDLSSDEVIYSKYKLSAAEKECIKSAHIYELIYSLRAVKEDEIASKTKGGDFTCLTIIQ